MRLCCRVANLLRCFRPLRPILAVVFLIGPAHSLQADKLADGLIIDVSSGVHTIQNPVEIFLEPGHYSIHPVGLNDGGYYDARSPWNGNTMACFGDNHECFAGWTREVTIAAPTLGLGPAMYDDWLHMEVLQCTQASLQKDSPFWWVFPQWDSPDSALEAYRKAAAIDGPCVFEIESGGFVSFFERELHNPYAAGGVSLRLAGSVEPSRVEIDVFPGNGANILNPLRQQEITLMLYGRATVDLTKLRPETLSFTLLSSPIQFSLGGECVAEDANDDGLTDQACVITAVHETHSIASENQASIARLDGLLTSGQRILGQDVVTLRTKNEP